jgi:fluoride ion exporter CrcB/FEX
MNYIIDIVFVLILGSIGAVMRWVLSGRKRSLESFFEDDPYGNAGFALIVIGSIVLTVKYFPYLYQRISR